MMTEQRFIELLGAFGADLSRWPEGERIAAEALLAAAPHRIKDVWESERVFDRLLSLERDALAPIALTTRVLALAPTPAQAPRPARMLGRWSAPQWATGGAIAASLLLGVAAGYAGEPAANAEGEYAQMLTLTGAGAGAVFLSAMDEPEN
jgi:hypothetical protein